MTVAEVEAELGDLGLHRTRGPGAAPNPAPNSRSPMTTTAASTILNKSARACGSIPM